MLQHILPRRIDHLGRSIGIRRAQSLILRQLREHVQRIGIERNGDEQPDDEQVKAQCPPEPT